MHISSPRQVDVGNEAERGTGEADPPQSSPGRPGRPSRNRVLRLVAAPTPARCRVEKQPKENPEKSMRPERAARCGLLRPAEAADRIRVLSESQAGTRLGRAGAPAARRPGSSHGSGSVKNPKSRRKTGDTHAARENPGPARPRPPDPAPPFPASYSRGQWPPRPGARPAGRPAGERGRGGGNGGGDEDGGGGR